MQDELKPVIQITGEFIAKVVAKKIYKSFGYTVYKSDTSDDSVFELRVRDDGTLDSVTLARIEGFAIGWAQALVGVIGVNEL